MSSDGFTTLDAPFNNWQATFMDYPGADGGKKAHYMVRWVNTRCDKGPWSETVSVTMGA